MPSSMYGPTMRVLVVPDANSHNNASVYFIHSSRWPLEIATPTVTQSVRLVPDVVVSTTENGVRLEFPLTPEKLQAVVECDSTPVVKYTVVATLMQILVLTPEHTIRHKSLVESLTKLARKTASKLQSVQTELFAKYAQEDADTFVSSYPLTTPHEKNYALTLGSMQHAVEALFERFHLVLSPSYSLPGTTVNSFEAYIKSRTDPTN